MSVVAVSIKKKNKVEISEAEAAKRQNIDNGNQVVDVGEVSLEQCLNLLCWEEVQLVYCFFFSSRRRHTRYWRDWSSDVCSSDLTSGWCASGRRCSTAAATPR